MARQDYRDLNKEQLIELLKARDDRFVDKDHAWRHSMWLEFMFQRLTLAKAFRGELVPQDPNDEPACVLLERVSTANPAEKNHRNKNQAT